MDKSEEGGNVTMAQIWADKLRPAPAVVQSAWERVQRAARVVASTAEGTEPDAAAMSRYSAAEGEYLRTALVQAVRTVLGVDENLLRYDPQNGWVEVGLTPVTADAGLALEDGATLLHAGLTCHRCGRITWHPFRSRRHFQVLVNAVYWQEKRVLDERRVGKDEALCVFCEKGVPTWLRL